MAKDDGSKAGKVTKKAGGKALSPYNKYMKDNVAKVKAENPGISHKDAFKKVALLWATAPENPKNSAK